MIVNEDTNGDSISITLLYEHHPGMHRRQSYRME